MNFRYLLVAAIGACLGVAALETFYHFGAGQNVGSRGEIQQVIRDYIIAHPEVLQEAMAEFEKRQTVADAEKARDAVKRNSNALFNSSHQVVAGNKQGDVTLVEFFDYNCPYCREGAPALNKLIAADGKVRLVLKELPVLGKDSEEVARIALAAVPHGKYLELHQRLFAEPGRATKASKRT